MPEKQRNIEPQICAISSSYVNSEAFFSYFLCHTNSDLSLTSTMPVKKDSMRWEVSLIDAEDIVD